MFTGIGSLGGLIGGVFFAVHHKYSTWGIIGCVVAGSILGSIAGVIVDDVTGV